MTQYNLLIMLNDPYVNLYIIFKFLHKNTDLNNLNKIIVNNIGLSDKNKILKNKYNKQNIMKQIKSLAFYCNSQEWFESLTYKTKSLLQIISNKDNLPIIMIDTDMLFLKDFNKFINTFNDIQVCKREFESPRKDINLSMKYIASYLIINKNNQKVISFLNDWIKEIENMIKKKLKPAYETPSMCKMIEKYNNILKIDELDERKISCDKKYIENITHIIHMKSMGNEEGNGNFDNRGKCINFSKKDILKYLD